MPRFRTALGLVVVFGLVGAAPASAANRFASPSGTGVEPCSSASPATACPIETAVNGAVSGDDVTLLAGPYATSTLLDAHPGVTVHGTTGAAPVVSSSATAAFEIEAGSALRDVDIEHSNVNGAAFFAFGAGSVVERVFAHASQAPIACEAGAESLLRDVVCWHTGMSNADSAALKPYNNDVSTRTVTLRNVTAVSSTAPGVVVQTSFGNINVAATNVIARGASIDVGRQKLGTGTASAVFDHSNYASESDLNNEMTDPGSGTGNATAPPAFVNSATGDFHETPLSTGTIDLGSPTGVLPAELDVDGQTRSQGAAPDIGAYEIAPAQSSPGVTPSPTTPTGQRAAALKKCKKKHGRKRKKCKKKANLLPV